MKGGKHSKDRINTVETMLFMIHKGMSINEVVRRYPETIRIFEKHGLGCAGCQAALFENIEQGAEVHGINVNALIDDLNRTVLTDR